MATDPENQAKPRPDEARSALQRKVMRGQKDRQARAMSLPKALRLSMAKAADQSLGMSMAVIGARQNRISGEALGDVIPQGHLLLLLEGSGQGRAAAATMDPALVGALMQQQTMGKVTPLIEGDTRRLTSTDAAICAPFLEDVMTRAAQMAEEPQERELIQGYSFGAQVEEVRLLQLALGAPEYEQLELTIDIAAGTRQGILTLVMPAVDVLPQPEVPQQGGPVEAAPRPPQQLDRVVLALDVDLRVALSTLTLPLGQVQNFAVGDVLDLGVGAFDQASVQTCEGRKLSGGTLGQIDGMRALQVEHQSKAQRDPRRRASDRATLNLPQVSGDGTGTRADAGLPALADMSEQVDTMAELAALEDQVAALPEGAEMGDLTPLADLPDVPELSDLADLPDLPDMSDLPGFDDEDDLLPLEAGIR